MTVRTIVLCFLSAFFLTTVAIISYFAIAHEGFSELMDFYWQSEDIMQLSWFGWLSVGIVIGCLIGSIYMETTRRIPYVSSILSITAGVFLGFLLYTTAIISLLIGWWGP